MFGLLTIQYVGLGIMALAFGCLWLLRDKAAKR